MFRCAFSVIRSIRPLSFPSLSAARKIQNDYRGFTSLTRICCKTPNFGVLNTPLVNKQILDLSKDVSVVPLRTVTKFSFKKGKRKSVKAVTKRFFRLHWGGWIRTKVSRKKRLWTKSADRKRRLRQHVFCNSTQNTLLDKMVTKFWKRPKYYVEDPYAPYHTREEFHLTRTKPKVH